MFYRKFRNNAIAFQLKRYPSLRIGLIMELIFARLFCMTSVVALFIGGGLSCKSAESGSYRALGQNTEEMVSLWDIYCL